MNTSSVDPLARLLRLFAVDLLTAQSWSVLPEIMADDYRLNIGGHVIAGRDTRYRPAMEQTFAQFPGLCVTVHDVLLGRDAMAMRFTEHGASRRSDGRSAAWQGVSLFRLNGGRMQVGWAEEDYFSRKRQLETGLCDSIEPPAPAPWDTVSRPPDAAIEATVREWVQSGALVTTTSVHWAGDVTDPISSRLLEEESVTVDDLFSAGERVAFHATLAGTYRGGFAGIDPGPARGHSELRIAGIATVRGDAVVEARVVSDRLGLQRALQPR
jgi:predicted ester cyclase